MRKSLRTWRITRALVGFVICLTSCVGSNVPAPAAPAPVESVPPPVVRSTSTTWNFNFAPGLLAYRISRSAEITEEGGSQARTDVSTNSTHESLTLQSAGDTIAFTAVVDTFSTTTQAAIGPVQAISLPIQLSGVRVADSIAISNDTLTQSCNPVASALITDVHNLLPRLPALLTLSMSWKDSTHLIRCQGSIPTRSRVLHSYHVLGENMYEGARTVIVQRSDTIQAEGEGAQQQHHLTLTANGTGTTLYYLDAVTGRITHLSIAQDLELSVTASGKTNHFRQTTKQEFALVR